MICWVQSGRVYGQDALLATFTEVTIEIDDQVTDGCWPRPAAVREVLEVELRRGGYKVLSESDFGSYLVPRVVVQGLGYGTSGLCIVTMEMAVRDFADVEYWYPRHNIDGKVSFRTFVDLVQPKRVVMSGAKGTMQDHIRNRAIEDWTSIYLEILKAREAVFARHPELKGPLPGAE